MNYDGHEALRRDMAGLANNLCDLKTTLKCWKTRTTTGTTDWRNGLPVSVCDVSAS